MNICGVPTSQLLQSKVKEHCLESIPALIIRCYSSKSVIKVKNENNSSHTLSLHKNENNSSHTPPSTLPTRLGTGENAEFRARNVKCLGSALEMRICRNGEIIFKKVYAICTTNLVSSLGSGRQRPPASKVLLGSCNDLNSLHFYEKKRIFLGILGKNALDFSGGLK